MTVTKGLKSFKVVIVGDASVGKTSILGTLAYGVFDGNYNATIGVDYVPKIVSLADGSTVKLNIWDTAGQEKFKSLIPTFLRDMIAGIVVFNICDRSSFENIRSWVRFIQQEQGDEIVSQLYLVGNKLDMDSTRQVTNSEALELSNELGLKSYTELSAKTGFNIKELFSSIASSIPQATTPLPRVHVKLEKLDQQAKTGCNC